MRVGMADLQPYGFELPKQPIRPPTADAPALSLGCLPDEILQQIILHVPASDTLLNVQLISRRFHDVGNQPLLWRHHCRMNFRYWDAKHNIRQKYAQGAGHIEWKILYTYRRSVDIRVSSLLEGIVRGQTNRIARFEAIAGFGYDAKDTLLRNCLVDDDAEDVLARRYYATSVLDHIHRTKAISEWSSMLQGHEVSLERALGAYDLFVLHDQFGDLDEISDMLDDLMVRLRLEHPDVDAFTTRGKAIAAAKFLRRHNLTGLDDEFAYRDMQNNFIGIALQDSKHPSLPLISCAIYSSLVQRLGLDARCCGIPNHVHTIVYAPIDETLDGGSVNPDSPREVMFLDPFRHDQEVPVDSLKRMLSDWGVHPTDFDGYLTQHNNPYSVVLRTSRNILATIHAFRTTLRTSNQNTSVLIRGNPFTELEHAFYASLWASFIFATPETFHEATQRQFVPLLIEKFEAHFPMDASLIEKYVCPLFDPTTRDDWNLFGILRVVRAADQTPKQVRLRRAKNEGRELVKYRVGQVIRHRRYNYIAVIVGWDVECGMDNDWIEQNRVDSLARGRHQGFYHALSSSLEETVIRYVAEDNIEIIEPELPSSLMGVAGRYFKRWDSEARRFVSNITDEYPDD